MNIKQTGGKDLFGSLADLKLRQLADTGQRDLLAALDANIDWEVFRGIVEGMRPAAERGRPRLDAVMMFKGLVAQSLRGLSDDMLEWMITDCWSYQRFLGLGPHEKAPDAKTFWSFRDDLAKRGVVRELFEKFHDELRRAGYEAKGGQIIDASIVPAPAPRNSREEQALIEEGGAPEEWSEGKRRQTDADARWTRKNGRSRYGYKSHVSVDRDHKLIRAWDATDAATHDTNVFESLLADNDGDEVWADKAYFSGKREKGLAERGLTSRILRRGARGHPLTDDQKRENRRRSRTRVRVEHVFGAQRDLRDKSVRCVGLTRARCEIGLMNLVCNMRRLCFLNRVHAA